MRPEVQILLATGFKAFEMEPFTSKVSKISERVLFSDFRKYKGLSLYIQFLFTKEKGSLFNMKVWMKLLVKKKGPYPFWI